MLKITEDADADACRKRDRSRLAPVLRYERHCIHTVGGRDATAGALQAHLDEKAAATRRQFSLETNAGRRCPPTIRVEPARRSSSSSKGRSWRLATESCAQGTKVAAPMSEASGFHSSRAVSCSAFSATAD